MSCVGENGVLCGCRGSGHSVTAVTLPLLTCGLAAEGESNSKCRARHGSCPRWPLFSLLSSDSFQLFHVSLESAEQWGYQRSSAPLPWGPGPAQLLCQVTYSFSFPSVPVACFAHLSVCPAHMGSQGFKQIFAPQADLCSQQGIRLPNPPAGRERGGGSSKYQPGTRRNLGDLVKVSRASQPARTRTNQQQPILSFSLALSHYHPQSLPDRLFHLLLTFCPQFCCFYSGIWYLWYESLYFLPQPAIPLSYRFPFIIYLMLLFSAISHVVTL